MNDDTKNKFLVTPDTKVFLGSDGFIKLNEPDYPSDDDTYMELTVQELINHYEYKITSMREEVADNTSKEFIEHFENKIISMKGKVNYLRKVLKMEGVSTDKLRWVNLI